jgi:hypothetical protein
MNTSALTKIIGSVVNLNSDSSSAIESISKQKRYNYYPNKLK